MFVAVPMLVMPLASGISRAGDVGWPEAVARLAGGRAKAEPCAALLKGHRDKVAIFEHLYN